MSNKNKNLTYETKCRRCGELTEWVYGEADRIEYMRFAKHMLEFVQVSPSRNCKNCKKSTVQDVVWYTEPHRPDDTED